jgi:hypothetical protein
MVVVAVAALDFTVLRAIMEDRRPNCPVLSLGTIPMATVLAIGLLFGYERLGNRSFLSGFELFGALALALYIILACCFVNETIGTYLVLFIDPHIKRIGTNRHLFAPIAYPGIAVMLVLQQLAFALLGGFLAHQSRVESRRGQQKTM